MNEAAAEHSVHVNQLRHWRKQAKEGLSDIFSREKQISAAEFKKKEQEVHNLYAEIGRLTTELTWLKKGTSPIRACCKIDWVCHHPHLRLAF